MLENIALILMTPELNTDGQAIRLFYMLSQRRSLIVKDMMLSLKNFQICRSLTF